MLMSDTGQNLVTSLEKGMCVMRNSRWQSDVGLSF